jgi:hypothetical protein
MKINKDFALSASCILVFAYFVWAFAQVDGLSLLDLGVALLLGWVVTPLFFVVAYYTIRDFARDVKKIWKNEKI